MRRASFLLAVAAVLLLAASFLPLPVAGTLATAQPTAVPTTAPAAVGHDLFLAKGCATCHQHDGADAETGLIGIGPNLTNYDPNPDFVREWLRDPAALRPGTMMPDLNLSENEIEALLAFLAE